MINIFFKNLFLMLILFIDYPSYSYNFLENYQNKLIDNCPDKEKIKCVSISKSVSNNSYLTLQSLNHYTINSEDIQNYSLNDLSDLLEIIPGFSINQSGPMGQQSSIFSRGTNSNHTLVLLNGVPINDPSTPQGLHDFGVDFIKNIDRVEIYPGSNGVHFGSNAIGGAINVITNIDYNNHFEIKSQNLNNYDFSFSNYLTTENDWLLNLKLNLLKTKYDSAIKDGTEKDQAKNFGTKINLEKWFNDNNRFFSNFYFNKTISDYDKTSEKELEYTGENLRKSIQFGIDTFERNYNDNYIFHINQYNREYREAGDLDEYSSESLFFKGERNFKLDDKFSLGFGADFKFDSGKFINRGEYSASARGNISNKSVFSNLGYEIFKNTTFSYFNRLDKNEITGNNNSEKYNLLYNLRNLKFGLTKSSGLRNPTIYELYGTDNFGYSGNLYLKPEKSKTYEIFTSLNLNDNLDFSLTAYKSMINNSIEYKNNTYANILDNLSLKQSGIESNISWKVNEGKISLFNTISESKKISGSDQLRRPSITGGFLLDQKLYTTLLGDLSLIAKYKYYGSHLDTDFYNYNIKKINRTNLFDLLLSKKINNFTFSIDVYNLLNENYQRPHGYSQQKRSMKFGLLTKF